MDTNAVGTHSAGDAVNLIKQSLHSLYPAGEVNYIIRIIFEAVLLWDRVDIMIRSAEAISDFSYNKIEAICERLSRHEPIQYILGEARFYGYTFHVDRSTLIPRPETEQLIEIIDRENKTPDLRVLDIGTGSGCIAITLARILKFPVVSAIDISDDAVAVALDNASRLKAKVAITQADVFSYTPQGHFDIIVSNPPYICESERASMNSNVTDYEPDTALFVPDNDPLRFYTRIAEIASGALSHGGKLYFEINPHYSKSLTEMLSSFGFDNITVHEDFNALARFISAQLP